MDPDRIRRGACSTLHRPEAAKAGPAAEARPPTVAGQRSWGVAIGGAGCSAMAAIRARGQRRGRDGRVDGGEPVSRRLRVVQPLGGCARRGPSSSSRSSARSQRPGVYRSPPARASATSSRRRVGTARGSTSRGSGPSSTSRHPWRRRPDPRAVAGRLAAARPRSARRTGAERRPGRRPQWATPGGARGAAGIGPVTAEKIIAPRGGAVHGGRGAAGAGNRRREDVREAHGPRPVG